MLVLGLVALHALVVRRFGRARVTLVVLASVAVVYFGLVLVFSVASGEKVLARGEEKYFCEIDCHLAYSVTDVQESKALAEVTNNAAATNERPAAGLFRVITIKTRFDETTIGQNRGNALLYPNSRIVSVVDENGKEYLPAPQAQRVLENSHGAGTPMTVPLRPSESYLTTLVFDLPVDIKNPTLLIRE